MTAPDRQPPKFNPVPPTPNPYPPSPTIHHPLRPWPAPERPWMMVQVWHDLLFAHWPLTTELLRPLLPASLSIDEYDGHAWLGVVPFWISGVRARGLPPMPWVSTFAEINVRTYVTAEAKPGIWFFSLDAESLAAVLGARMAFRLPYYHARLALRQAGEHLEYQSRRRAASARFVGRYRPTGPPRVADPSSIEAFLAERYCLYTADRRGRIYRGEIDHPPWQLQPAEAEISLNTMADPLGLRLPGVAPLLHYAHRQVARIWPIAAL